MSGYDAEAEDPTSTKIKAMVEMELQASDYSYLLSDKGRGIFTAIIPRILEE